MRRVCLKMFQLIWDERKMIMAYTGKEITGFLKAANSDLGSGKYSGDEILPDYCKAVIIGEQLQIEIEDWGKSHVKMLEHEKRLRGQVTQLQAELEGLEAAMVWSKKFDNIAVKDMREFLQALKDKL